MAQQKKKQSVWDQVQQTLVDVCKLLAKQKANSLATRVKDAADALDILESGITGKSRVCGGGGKIP